MQKFSSDSSRWRAVQTRDKSAHSTFVYAVLTTKIVCRPTCPSRLARRSNVKYYDTVTEAFLDGFRSCKRCQPELPAEMDRDAAVVTVTNACRLIENAGGHIKLTEVATATGFSSRHLHNLFMAKLGCTPAAYAAQLRQITRECESSSIQSSTTSIASPFAIDSPDCSSCETQLDDVFDALGNHVPLDRDSNAFEVGSQTLLDNDFTVWGFPEGLDLGEYAMIIQSEA